MADETNPQTAATGDPAPEGETPQAPETFDAWIASQPENIRGLYEQSVAGLKSALGNERTSRKQLEKQLGDLARTADEGSKAKEQLEKMASDVRAANLRADFYEAAVSAKVNPQSVKLAFLAATEDGLISEKGEVDWPGLKQRYPDLFLKPAAQNSNVGAGVGQQEVARPFDMNKWIRGSR